MSEEAETITEQPIKPTRKAPKRRKRAAARTAAVQVTYTSPLAKSQRAGDSAAVPKSDKLPEECLTKYECCPGCTPERCVISGVNVCGHPFKAGQVPAHDQAAVERYNRAKAVLRHQMVDMGRL